MKSEWLIADFSSFDVEDITEKILKYTKKTKCVDFGVFECKSKKDIEIIQKILSDKDKEIENTVSYMLYQTVKNFVNESHVWQNY